MSTYKRLFNYFLIYVGIVIFLACLGGVYALYSLKNSEPFAIARKTALENQDIQEQTGGITGTSFLIKGMMDEDSANFKFTVYGNTNNLWVNCILNNQDSTWLVRKLTYKLD